MGGKATKIEEVSNPVNPIGKTIEIATEICSSWGYGGKVDHIRSTIVKTLTDKGYSVNSTFIPEPHDKEALYIYKVEDGKRRIIYSNKAKKHANEPNVIINTKLNKETCDAIIESLLKW